MDAATITQLIGSLGFPIAACCFMGWYMTNIMKEFRDAMNDNTMALKELILTVREMKEGDFDDRA